MNSPPETSLAKIRCRSIQQCITHLLPPHGSDPQTVAGQFSAEVIRHLEDNQKMRDALGAIAKMQPKPIEDPFPPDWRDQIEVCPECISYRGHPIQAGICNAHRQPMYERERREKHRKDCLPYEMADAAREALRAVQEGME